jgi:uncharacterized protein (DUF427 family)
MVAMLNGKPLADSRDVIRVDEDGSPARVYFPRADVRMDQLQASATTTYCPFKGTAVYFSILGDGQQVLKDAAWSYEEPYDEHPDLKGRISFYVERAPQIQIVRE